MGIRRIPAYTLQEISVLMPLPHNMMAMNTPTHTYYVCVGVFILVKNIFEDTYLNILMGESIQTLTNYYDFLGHIFRYLHRYYIGLH